MHIALITAGGAGMFCGSCMHDNTWARALLAAGCEATLVPTYTPLRVDEPDQSEAHVYFGGVNLYLRSQWSWWRKLPRAWTAWLDRPRILRWAAQWSVGNDPAVLGELTLDMLAGEEGPHREAGAELARHVAEDLRPDVVIFSNALLVGALRQLRSAFAGPIYCTLQGDDVFLDALPERYRLPALQAIRTRAAEFDGFLVHTRFYRDYISRYLGLPVERFHQLPLGIDLDGHDGRPGERRGEPFTVGYFARIAPEKGLQHLVAGFRRLHAEHPEARLRAGGYLAPRQRSFFDDVRRAARPLGDAFEYVGSPPTHADKVRFFRSIDVLSVPTEFLEPKGLYVLEALANGVPVVQPAHGAFPELIEQTGGGLLVPPRDPAALAEGLTRLLRHPQERYALGSAGQQAVRERFSMAALARATLEIVGAAQRTPAAGGLTAPPATLAPPTIRTVSDQQTLES